MTFIANSLTILAYVSLTGDDRAPQDIYGTGASGDPATFIAATFFFAVITPIGEEFLFREVVTTALLRVGPFTGIVGGALIFALSHGANMVLSAAFVVSFAAGEVFRRSGSIWPTVTVHSVVNLSFGGPAAYAFSLLHGAGNGIPPIAKGTLPLALFGAAGYGWRIGWLNAPARILQSAAPLIFGAALTAWGVSGSG